MRRIRRVLRAIAPVLGLGAILYVFSERVFWSLWRPDEDLPGVIGGILLYAFLAFVLLVVLRGFRVSDLPGLFLSGAIFGWLNEGVVAMTLFGDASMPFPFTIAWTGLAWHALLSVTVGVLALRRALGAGTIGPVLGMGACIGAFWGFWAAAWGSETPPILAPIPEFFGHALATTALLAAGELGLTVGPVGAFRPPRWTLWAAGTCILAFLALVTVPTVPWSPLILLPLFAVPLLALRRRSTGRESSAILEELGGPVPARNLAALLLIPCIATAVYGALNEAGSLPPSHQIVFFVSSLASVVMLAVALVRHFRGRDPGVAAEAASDRPHAASGLERSLGATRP